MQVTSTMTTSTTKPDAGSIGSEHRSTCPVACTLDVVGDRWTLLVVRDLLGGKRRFGEFLESAEHIPTNILADRLKRLQSEGLLDAVPYSHRPKRFEYYLTREGRALARTVSSLSDWGLRHFPGTRRASWAVTLRDEP
jgi:DNA-binding HxlR family transcriptional regulator